MMGGDPDKVKFCEPIFKTLAPPDGYVYCGASGSGHYVKMVHNGIEYGMLQSYGEGFDILHASEYKLDLTAIASAWRYGSVVRSWLLDLLVLAFKDDTNLQKIKGYVEDFGEGRWTIQEAIDHNVPAPVITASLFERFHSRETENFAAKVIASLRNEFGGHAVKNIGADGADGTVHDATGSGGASVHAGTSESFCRSDSARRVRRRGGRDNFPHRHDGGTNRMTTPATHDADPTQQIQQQNRVNGKPAPRKTTPC